VQAAELRSHVGEVLKQDRYQWRMPRELPEGAVQEDSLVRQSVKWLQEMVGSVFRWFGEVIVDWLKGLFDQPDREVSQRDSKGGAAWGDALQQILIGLLIVLGIALVWILVRQWRRMPVTAVAKAASSAEINLESEQIVASQLPENEWLRLAQEKAEAGDYRLAMRALFLATLAHLGEARLIAISRWKSNGDYVRELGYRARDREGLRSGFSESVRTFDAAWYGWHEVSQDQLERVRHLHSEITTEPSGRAATV
jgi:hypothetical protein